MSSRLGPLSSVNRQRVARAIEVILRAFTVVPFYRRDIVVDAHQLRDKLRDFIDRVVVATAIALGEDLATEDSEIRSLKNYLESQYGIKVYSYGDLVPL